MAEPGKDETRKLEPIIKDLKRVMEPVNRLPIKNKVVFLDGVFGLYEECGYHPHEQRVSEISTAIADEDGRLKRRDIKMIKQAALLHDIGKMGVSDGIIRKNGSLTLEEEEEGRKHTVYGDCMLKEIGLKELAHLARYHHERMDGNGYPDGLKGADLGLVTRIIAAADTYDAMKSRRYYRSVEMSDEVIAGELKRVSNQDFNKTLLMAYIIEKLEKLEGNEKKLKVKIAYYNRFMRKQAYTLNSLQGIGVEELEGIYIFQRISQEGQLDSRAVNALLGLKMEELLKIRERYPDRGYTPKITC